MAIRERGSNEGIVLILARMVFKQNGSDPNAPAPLGLPEAVQTYEETLQIARSALINSIRSRIKELVRSEKKVQSALDKKIAKATTPEEKEILRRLESLHVQRVRTFNEALRKVEKILKELEVMPEKPYEIH